MGEFFSRIILAGLMAREKATGARSVELVLFERANHRYDHHQREVAAGLGGWMDRLM